MQALHLTAGHRDRLLVQGEGPTQQRSFGPYKTRLQGTQHLAYLVCMPMAFHVLCVLTCVRRSAGTRRQVITVSLLSGACCLLCLCYAYCCGCCDASSGDAYACSSTHVDCYVARAGRRASQPQRTNPTRPREGACRPRRRGGGEYVYCVYMCMHLYASVCLPQY
jgi:hypothetical protein